MKIIFNNIFYEDIEENPSSRKERMESIISDVKVNNYEMINCFQADERDILRVHKKDYFDNLKKNENLFNLAKYSVGGAIKASEIGYSGEPAFACIKPPGHHAYKAMGWGYCHFSNMAVALKKLKAEGRINSAFVLDFDAHTGDGTIDCLNDWNECYILNPMADDSKDYIKKIENYINNLPKVDIIGVCAGFDSYEKDVGKKLSRFDFYVIGRIIRNFAKKLGHNRRFATLEGGYYYPDLGKNVVSFCEGMEAKY